MRDHGRACCIESSITGPNVCSDADSFDCATAMPSLGPRGVWKMTMIETVTGIFGLLSASIFVAHAYEAYRGGSIRVPSRRFRNL